MANKNNMAVRMALVKAGMRQYQLAELLGVSEAYVSIMLRHELSEKDQNRLVKIIKDGRV